MTSNARTGRRRRILHDGAAGNTPTPNGGEPQPATRQRYTPREGSASFAVATSVLPRSPLALLATVFALAAVTAGLAWADQIGVTLAASGAQAAAARLLLIDQPGSLAAWWEAALWLAVATQSVLLFGMRKHRTNDTRGAYRWWLAVAGVSLAMSVGAATTAPAVVASQMAGLTGFSPLADHAFWWFAPGCLVLAALGVRSLMEVKESPVAGAAGVLAGVLIAGGWSVAAGVLPRGWVVDSPLLAPVATLTGVSLTLLTLLAYSRRIVRETLGELQPPKPAAKPAESGDEGRSTEPARSIPSRTKPSTADRDEAEPQRPRIARTEPELVERPAARRAKKRREEQAESEETRWVSGPEGDDAYEDDGPQRRKLSKSERKRLRREKARRAA